MNPYQTTRRHNRGFTLVELMVTLFVASILTALAAPSFSRFVTNSRLAEQTNELIGAIHFTRSEAIRRNARLTLCRVDSESATVCAGDNETWQHWVVRNAAGDVVRRGVVQTYGGTLRVIAKLDDDAIEFGSDGLARTGGVLVNAGLNDVGHGLQICSNRQADENVRTVVLGAGSRVTTTKESGSC